MRTIRTKIYQFSELSKAAQKVAIENSRDINVDYYWYQVTFWDASDIGLKLMEFDFDSASFVRNLTGEFLNSADYTANLILENHGKDTETYKSAANYIQEVKNNVKEPQTGFLNNLLIDYTQILQNEFEYRQMDSAVIETLVENEYEFKADGTRF